MRGTRTLMKNIKKSSSTKIPVEMYPLFAAIGFALSSAVFFSYKHLTNDKQLRFFRTPNLSMLDDALKNEKN